MSWRHRYSIRSYIRSALWIVPVLAVITEIIIKRLSEQFGSWMVNQGVYDLKTGFFAVNAAEAHAILDRIFTLNLSCLVFTFGSLLVAIQVASGQYTPRIIATTLLCDNVIRWIVGLFVFTLLWANRTMVLIGQSGNVPQMQIFLAVLFALASLIAFIILIDYCAKLLRPVSLVRRVAEQGITVIQSVYPNPTQGIAAETLSTRKRSWTWLARRAPEEITYSVPAIKRGAPDRVILHRGKSAIVLAVNWRGLIREAQRAGCVIEFAVQVGDFLSVDEPIFYIHGNAEAVNDQRLFDLVALGSERTMEQDPMFSFRIEVDIALKALSAAINDPTTAVLAIDQLHRLLRMVGKRSLRDQGITDHTGQPRVVLRTPNWEDFVHISFREIRHCGAGNLQIERRLRAMIENLTRTLPEHRHPALLVELDLLNRTITQQHCFDEDIALAMIPDSQGLGGASGAQP